MLPEHVHKLPPHPPPPPFPPQLSRPPLPECEVQALFNLAMLPEHVSIMTRYKVPNYIHMGNMPASHLRPMTAPPALGHRMAKLGLIGTAPARAVATAPAGIAVSGLG